MWIENCTIRPEKINFLPEITANTDYFSPESIKKTWLVRMLVLIHRFSLENKMLKERQNKKIVHSIIVRKNHDTHKVCKK